MRHLNGNLLAVIDTETTGSKPRFNDIIEVAVLVLDKNLKPAEGIRPFTLDLIPKRLENIDLEALRIQRKTLDDLVKEKVCNKRERIVRTATRGIDPDLGADLFKDWWDKLRLAPFKRIMPIACNWAFDREFLIDWLGEDAFQYYFDPRYRDVMSMTLYDNDVSDWRGEPFEYAKNNLQYICTTLKIERTQQHTALDDCVATAEAYRKIIQRTQLRTLPYEQTPEVSELPAQT